jgi:glutathione S-transferase
MTSAGFDVPEIKTEHPFERFKNEALRLVRGLDGKLGDSPWVCCDEFTVGDIAL